MSRIKSLPVDELIRRAIIEAHSYAKENDLNPPEKRPDPSEFRRSAAVADIIAKAAGERAIEHLVPIVKELDETMNVFHGVRFRHLDRWIRKSAEEWTIQINDMALRNQLIRTTIGPEDLRSEYEELEIDLSTKALTGNVSEFKAEAGEAWTDDMPMFDLLSGVLDKFDIILSQDEAESLGRKRAMSRVYEFLNEKLHKRKPNDGGVYYGGSWSQTAIQQTYEYFDRFGGINGAATNCPMKHLGDFGFGLTRRVPKKERTGRLADADAPIRVVNRENDEQYDYYDFEEMIDDRWVAD